MPGTMQALRAEAARLIGEGRYGAAAIVLYRDLGSEPRELALLANLGRACHRIGLAEEAARIFRTCLERRREPAFLDGLGAALLALGRHQEAEGFLCEAVADDPLLVDAWANLARMGRLRLGDPLRERISHTAADSTLPALRRQLLGAVLAAVDAASARSPHRFGPA